MIVLILFCGKKSSLILVVYKAHMRDFFLALDSHSHKKKTLMDFLSDSLAPIAEKYHWQIAFKVIFSQ